MDRRALVEHTSVLSPRLVARSLIQPEELHASMTTKSTLCFLKTVVRMARSVVAVRNSWDRLLFVRQRGHEPPKACQPNGRSRVAVT